MAYLKKNWGAPFIVLFMLLLVRSSVDYVRGFPRVAEEIAVYAFYSLVLGIILQLASDLKIGSSKSEEGGSDDPPESAFPTRRHTYTDVPYRG